MSYFIGGAMGGDYLCTIGVFLVNKPVTIAEQATARLCHTIQIAMPMALPAKQIGPDRQTEIILRKSGIALLKKPSLPWASRVLSYHCCASI